MKILEVPVETAAILADKGPLGKNARRQLSHDVRKTGVQAKLLAVFDLSDDSLVCIITICEDILANLPIM